MWQAGKTFIKRAITASLYYSGVAWLCKAIVLRRRTVVLMYHRVLPAQPRPDAFSADAIVVTPATFERHMRFLRRFFNVITVEQLRSMLSGERSWIPRSCVVTFDDGWFDNVEHALPVLNRNSVPAIVFVATAYLGTRQTFWQERLTRLLFGAWRLGQRSQPIFQELQSSDILLLQEEPARAAIRQLITRLKTGTQEQISELIGRLEHWLLANGVAVEGYGDDRFMSWSQAAALQNSGLVAVASHAHSHAPLTSISPASVAQELRESTQHLRAHLDREPRFLAYPNGDYNEQVTELARSAGFQLAFTTDIGWVAPGDDPLRLKRINISERGTQSNAGFLCRLLGWF